MREYLRGIISSWQGKSGLPLFMAGFLWKVLGAWSNLDFLSGKLASIKYHLPPMLDMLFSQLPNFLIGAGIILLLWQGYLYQKKTSLIEGEILDMVLGNKPDKDFPNFTVATYILMGMRIVNRGPAIVIILDWSLTVQFGDSAPVEAKKVSIPENMRIEKKSPNIFEAPFVIIPDPLDQKTKDSPLRRDDPIVGWVLFELPTTEIPDPRGARFCVRLTDSLSQVHEIVQKAKPFVETGRIIYPAA